jgi:hypothetical protein
VNQWSRALLAGALAGLAALALLLLVNELSGDRLMSEVADYLRKRDEFKRYLEERETDDGPTANEA